MSWMYYCLTEASHAAASQKCHVALEGLHECIDYSIDLTCLLLALITTKCLRFQGTPALQLLSTEKIIDKKKKRGISFWTLSFTHESGQNITSSSSHLVWSAFGGCRAWCHQTYRKPKNTLLFYVQDRRMLLQPFVITCHIKRNGLDRKH